MKKKFPFRLIQLLLLLCLLSTLAGCGEFIYSKDDIDTGTVCKMHISMSDDKLQRFCSSMTADNYTSCFLTKGNWRGEAEIKIRGMSSRMYSKKSFTLKIDGKKYMLERGESNGGLYNRIAMRAYQLAGVTACDTESIALFLKDEYLGCYNLITYYDSSTMSGELYKVWFKAKSNMDLNHPLSSLSKKKFPDDNNMANLEHLEYACTSLPYADWCDFVNANVDIQKTAAYLVVHDFLTVKDTSRTNYYIQYDGKYRMIPWDNEQCMQKRRADYTLCTENQLVSKVASVPEFKTAYNQKMQELFIGGGDTCILDALRIEAADMFDRLTPAMEKDPCFPMNRKQFMAEKTYVLNYLDKTAGRAAEVDKLTLH